MGKNIAPKRIAQLPCFRKFLHAVVEDIPVVARTFLIQRGDAEYIRCDCGLACSQRDAGASAPDACDK